MIRNELDKLQFYSWRLLQEFFLEYFLKFHGQQVNLFFD